MQLGNRIVVAEAAFASSPVFHPFRSAKLPLCISQRKGLIPRGFHHEVRAVHSNADNKNAVGQRIPHSDGEADSLLCRSDSEEVLRDRVDQSSENAWYSVIERIGRLDTGRHTEATQSSLRDSPVVDLTALEDAGRQLLTQASYDTIVDVDIERGGVLNDDEDNNDLHCGVELDALVDSSVLVENLRNDFGIETATHVQLAAIPRVLDGRDLVIQSHTGTGKTLAFLLPILDAIDTEGSTTQAVIIAPTRELAMQISRECDRLVSGTDIRNLALIGGANPARQVEKLRKRQPHIVVGTPGRLAELCDQNELRTFGVRSVVVDEVDQCLGETFLGDVVKLFKAIPHKQKTLVSATGDVDRVRQFAGMHLHRPVLLRVGGSQRIPKRIQHYCCTVPARMKIQLVKKLMSTSPIPKQAIAFVDDPRRVDIVVEKLGKTGLVAVGLKGTAHKLERADVLSAFKKGRVSLLVTTEVAARGLDVRGVTHIFNLDLPTDGDHYLHRAGRCGRAGEDGFVVNIASPDKAFVVNKLAAELCMKIPRMEPRHGMYKDPSERDIGGANSPDIGRENTLNQEGGRWKRRNAIVKKQQETATNQSIKDTLVGLQDALERDDAQYIEQSFLQQRKNDFGTEDKNFAELRRVSPKKKKKRKQKTREKSKGKTSVQSAEQKTSKGATRDVSDNVVTDANTMASRQERRAYRRLQSDYTQRAAMEGWVGNRNKMKNEETSKTPSGLHADPSNL